MIENAMTKAMTYGIRDIDESMKKCESQIEHFNNAKLLANDKNTIEKCNEKLKSLEEEYEELKNIKIVREEALWQYKIDESEKESSDTLCSIIAWVIIIIGIWIAMLFATHGDSFILFN